MPARTITAGGRTWRIFPSGFVTQYDQDEFGVIFISGVGDEREVRVTRYSPLGSKAREESLAEMSESDLARLFELSQPSFTSPEAGYAP
jgi:hypothetical protein